MAFTRHPADKATDSLSGFLTPGRILPILAIALPSLSGALLFPLSRFGRTGLSSISRDWALLAAVSWVVLVAWAVAFSWLLRRRAGLSRQASLLWAAGCHLPLLLCVALVGLLYRSDQAYHAYMNTPFGQVIFQPAAQGYVFLAPALAQGAWFTWYYRRSVVRTLPVAAVLLIALSLRIWSLDWALPALYHPDEHHYLGQASVMLATGDLNPHYFENPTLLIYMVYLLDRLLPQQTQAFHVVNDFFRLGILDPRGDYLVDLAARGISALAGTLTVLLVYLVGRRLFDRGMALFSALLLAVSFLHVRNSHFATNDVLATFFLVASLYFAAGVYRRGLTRDYLLAGLMGGLGTSAKYNVGFFGVAILLAHLVRTGKRPPGSGIWRSHTPLLLSALVSLAGFLMGTPYAILDWPAFQYGFQKQYGFGGEIWAGQADLPSPLLYLQTVLQGFGVAPLALAVVGAFWLAQRDRRLFLVIVSVPLTYLAAMATQRLFFARFAIPVLPVLCLLAGYAFSGFRTRLGHSRARSLWPVALAVIALAQPLAMSWQHDVLMGREDTRAQAVAWIDRSAPRDATVAIEAVSRMNSPFGWKSGQSRSTPIFVPGREQDEKDLFGGGIDYAIVTSYGYDSPDSSGKLEPQPLYGRLATETPLSAIVRPGVGSTDLDYALDDAYSPFWHLFDRAFPGPTVKIYQLPSPP